MHENGEPASPGTIEEVRAGDLGNAHTGRPVRFGGPDGKTVHGVLREVIASENVGTVGVVLTGPVEHEVEVDSVVSVIVQTAAEAAAERRARITEEAAP